MIAHFLCHLLASDKYCSFGTLDLAKNDCNHWKNTHSFGCQRKKNVVALSKNIAEDWYKGGKN